MSKSPVRAIKRIGTVGNYLRLTPSNEHLLNDSRMVEVTLNEVDGRLVEANTTSQDFLASKDLARIVGEIKTLDAKRESLVAHASNLIGGNKVLKEAGIELPEQNIHDTPAGRVDANNKKQNDKAKQAKEDARQKRAKRKAEIDAANAKAENDANARRKANDENVMAPPRKVKEVNDQTVFDVTDATNDEDI